MIYVFVMHLFIIWISLRDIGSTWKVDVIQKLRSTYTTPYILRTFPKCAEIACYTSLFLANREGQGASRKDNIEYKKIFLYQNKRVGALCDFAGTSLTVFSCR